MHEDDEWLGMLVFHDERLHHMMFVHTQLARRFACAAMLDIIVRMLAENDAMTAQELRGRRFGYVSGFTHRRIVMASLRNGYLPNGQLCGSIRCGTIVRKSSGAMHAGHAIAFRRRS
jgi:uncharacterized protein (DUF1810 family)